MADKHAEALCGLMDGELNDSEARFLIRRVGQDRELAARWGRYHLARSVVRERLRINLNGLATRVSAALESDTSPRFRPSFNWLSRLKPVGGIAVAAGVALVVFNVWRGPAVESAAPPVQTQALADASLQQYSASPQATPASWNPRLQTYLIRHNEATAPRRSQGLVPYWYLVSDPPPKKPPAQEPEPQPNSAED